VEKDLSGNQLVVVVVVEVEEEVVVEVEEELLCCCCYISCPVSLSAVTLFLCQTVSVSGG